MKKRVLSLLCLAAMGLSSAVSAELYVAPNGDDANNGQFDTPFQTLSRAQTELRKMVREGLKEDVTIYLRGGRHELSKPVVFSFEDSPNGGANSLTIAGYDSEQAVLSAGKKVVGWQKCDVYPEGTPDAAKGNLWVADIPDGVCGFKSMFDGETRLTRAKSEEFVMPGNDVVKQADSRNVLYNKDRIHLRMLPFEDQIKDWENLSDVELFFNPVPWCINFIPIESVDMENRIAYLEYEANAMPFSAGQHSFAFVENVVDYLDEAGEWCVNTKSRKIYYWPESGEPSCSIYVPQMREMIKVEGDIRYDLQTDIPVENIHFENLTFTHGDRSSWYKDRKGWGIQHDWDTFDYDNAMLRFRGAEGCSVKNCNFSNSGGSAMRLDLHAQNITIENNYIAHVGHMGILLAGYGPGTKDVNHHNTIKNNIIHDCGEIIWHGHAIFAWQSGENLISHNYIHDVPRKAVGICGVRCQILLKDDNNFDEASKTIRWSEIESTIDSTKVRIIERYAPYLHARNNIVEYNHVERTLLKLSDGSSLNVSGAGLGNIVRNNYLYDIPHVGIRMDDWQDGTLVENNLLHKVGKSGIVFKGINVVQNNVLINCAKAFHFRAYPKQFFETDGVYIGSNVVYSDQADFEPNTIFKWNTGMEIWNRGTKPIPYEYDMDYNSYWWSGAEADLALKRENGIEEHGVVMDPKFKDLENRDYRVTNKKLIDAVNFNVFDTTISNYGIDSSYPAPFIELDPTL
ncbi:MAG: right-handed parallel beta-helix repeat-containing protein [Rikenellaceae bacterium]